MTQAAPGSRRVGTVVALLAAAALAGLAFLTHAPNRLLSGVPIGVAAGLDLAGAAPVTALGAGILLVLLPLAWAGRLPLWAVFPGAALVLGGAAWVAGAAAVALEAGGSASARTSVGGGWWVLVAAALLLAADAARRLGLRPAMAMAVAAAVAAPFAIVLASGAVDRVSVMREYDSHRALFADALLRHVWIVVLALVPTLALGVPLGLAAWRGDRFRRAVFPILNIVQTVPSIALFGLLIGPLSELARAVPALARIGISGIGLAPAVIALVLYSLLPVVRNTAAGLDGVAAPIREAARGMGMTPRQVFWRVDAPLALPVMLSGVRITAVQAVGLAAVSALIGAGGLGAVMFQGLFSNALDLVLLGAIPIILLAVAVDMGFRVLAGLARAAT